MKDKFCAFVGALFCGVLASGCATIVNGTTQKIGVTSTPTAAEVLIDYNMRVTTPASVPLSRGDNHTFVFKKEGYQEDSFVLTSGTSGWVWGNIIAGGLIGAVVDLSSGGGRKLSQDSIHVTLTPLPAEPMVIPVPAVMTIEGSGGTGRQEARLLELKNLLDKGLLTQEEYETKRVAILNGL